MLDKTSSLAILASTAIASVVILFLIKTKNKKREWKKIGTLSSLYIYPFKGGKAVSLNKAEATEMGLREIRDDGLIPRRDRYFIAFEGESKKAISVMQTPKLYGVFVKSMNKNSVQFSYLDEKQIYIDTPASDSQIIKIFSGANEVMLTVDCGDKASSWISEVLNVKGLRIGFWSPTIKERRDLTKYYPEYAKIYKNMSNESSGAYSSLGSYLLTDETSLQDLNSRLPTEVDSVTPLHFRTNIHIKGTKPFDEENWNLIKIGGAIFQNFRPCTRCSIITINPETMIRNKNYEPLKTLKKFRMTKAKDAETKKVEDSPLFGVNMGLIQSSAITVGDEVFVLYK